MTVAGAASFKPDFAVALRRPPRGQPAVIEVRGGQLDSGTCEQLLETVEKHVAAGARRLTLDLRQMSFIDSAGMRSLIRVERIADEIGVSLSVTPPPEHVTELPVRPGWRSGYAWRSWRMPRRRVVSSSGWSWSCHAIRTLRPAPGRRCEGRSEKPTGPRWPTSCC